LAWYIIKSITHGTPRQAIASIGWLDGVRSGYILYLIKGTNEVWVGRKAEGRVDSCFQEMEQQYRSRTMGASISSLACIGELNFFQRTQKLKICLATVLEFDFKGKSAQRREYRIPRNGKDGRTGLTLGIC
jgi:hypothetical protein